jgi:hypothetical protein
MNGATVQHAKWSRRKWGCLIAAALIGQALLIVILGQRGIATPSAIPFGMDIRVSPKAGREMAESPTDPAVFALPNWNGFSREGWLAFQHPEFKSTDWTEPPQWLALQTADMGNSLNDFLLSNTIAPLLVANMRPPSSRAPQSPRVEVPLQTGSDLLIEGELAGWTLATAVALPSWRHTDLLTNSVVHVIVNRSGQSVATALLASGGLTLADDYAVRLAKGARFVAGTVHGEKAEYTSGNLVFRWHTQAPTNVAGRITLELP